MNLSKDNYEYSYQTNDKGHLQLSVKAKSNDSYFIRFLYENENSNNEPKLMRKNSIINSMKTMHMLDSNMNETIQIIKKFSTVYMIINPDLKEYYVARKVILQPLLGKL